MNTRLAELLDRCVEDVRRGRATAAQCLAAHPEHAAELAPLLELALHIGATAPAAPDAAALARVGARVRQWMRPAPAPLPWWRTLGQELPHRLAIGALATVAVLLIAVSSGLVIVSRGAAPGDRLYGLKRATEPVEMALRGGGDLGRHERLSARRLDELLTVARRGDAARTPAATTRFEREYDALLSAIGEAMATSPSRSAEAQQSARQEVQQLAEAAIKDPKASPLLASARAFVAGRLAELPSIANVTGAQGKAEAAIGASPPASSAGTTVDAYALAVALRASTVSGVFADLQRAITQAETSGVLSAAEARELRVLIDNVKQLGLGGDNVVVVAAMNRLADAIEECTWRACAAAEVLDALRGAVARSAAALGLPQPQPQARQPASASPAAPAAGSATRTAQGQPAPTTRPPATAGFAPSPPAQPQNATTTAAPAPTPAATARGASTTTPQAGPSVAGTVAAAAATQPATGGPSVPAPAGVPLPTAAPTPARTPTPAVLAASPPPPQSTVGPNAPGQGGPAAGAPTTPGVPSSPVPALAPASPPPTPVPAATRPPTPSPTSTPTASPTPTPTPSLTPSATPTPAGGAP